MVAIAAAVLVTFIGGLYFITHHKKEESETLQNQKVTGMASRQNRKSAGDTLKSWKAVSLAYVRLPNRLPAARC